MLYAIRVRDARDRLKRSTLLALIREASHLTDRTPKRGHHVIFQIPGPSPSRVHTGEQGEGPGEREASRERRPAKM